MQSPHCALLYKAYRRVNAYQTGQNGSVNHQSPKARHQVLRHLVALQRPQPWKRWCTGEELRQTCPTQPRHQGLVAALHHHWEGSLPWRALLPRSRVLQNLLPWISTKTSPMTCSKLELGAHQKETPALVHCTELEKTAAPVAVHPRQFSKEPLEDWRLRARQVVQPQTLLPWTS